MSTMIREPAMDLIASAPIDIGEAMAATSTLKVGDVDPKIDWPPTVILQAAKTKLYLSRVGRKGHHHNCEAAKAVPDQSCEFQVEVLPDHCIALKGDNGKFLSRMHRTRNGRGIDFAEFAKDTIDAQCKFRYFSLGNNEVALKGDNAKFLCHLVRKGQNNIEAASSDINDEAKFIVGEHLEKKDITDIEYDVAGATMRDIEPLVVISPSITNDSADIPITKELRFHYEKSEVGTWNSELGLSVGMEAEFTCKVPLIGEGKITLSTELTASHSFGGSRIHTQAVDDSTTVTVPPKTRLKVEVTVSRAIVSVNFTYTIKRLLPDGKITEQKGLKGVYRNVECYGGETRILQQGSLA